MSLTTRQPTPPRGRAAAPLLQATRVSLLIALLLVTHNARAASSSSSNSAQITRDRISTRAAAPFPAVWLKQGLPSSSSSFSSSSSSSSYRRDDFIGWISKAVESVKKAVSNVVDKTLGWTRRYYTTCEELEDAMRSGVDMYDMKDGQGEEEGFNPMPCRTRLELAMTEKGMPFKGNSKHVSVRDMPWYKYYEKFIGHIVDDAGLMDAYEKWLSGQAEGVRKAVDGFVNKYEPHQAVELVHALETLEGVDVKAGSVTMSIVDIVTALRDKERLFNGFCKGHDNFSPAGHLLQCVYDSGLFYNVVDTVTGWFGKDDKDCSECMGTKKRVGAWCNYPHISKDELLEFTIEYRLVHSAHDFSVFKFMADKIVELAKQKQIHCDALEELDMKEKPEAGVGSGRHEARNAHLYKLLMEAFQKGYKEEHKSTLYDSGAKAKVMAAMAQLHDICKTTKEKVTGPAPGHYLEGAGGLLSSYNQEETNPITIYQYYAYRNLVDVRYEECVEQGKLLFCESHYDKDSRYRNHLPKEYCSAPDKQKILFEKEHSTDLGDVNTPSIECTGSHTSSTSPRVCKDEIGDSILDCDDSLKNEQIDDVAKPTCSDIDEEAEAEKNSVIPEESDAPIEDDRKTSEPPTLVGINGDVGDKELLGQLKVCQNIKANVTNLDLTKSEIKYNAEEVDVAEADLKDEDDSGLKDNPEQEDCLDQSETEAEPYNCKEDVSNLITAGNCLVDACDSGATGLTRRDGDGEGNIGLRFFNHISRILQVVRNMFYTYVQKLIDNQSPLGIFADFKNSIKRLVLTTLDIGEPAQVKETSLVAKRAPDSRIGDLFTTIKDKATTLKHKIVTTYHKIVARMYYLKELYSIRNKCSARVYYPAKECMFDDTPMIPNAPFPAHSSLGSKCDVIMDSISSYILDPLVRLIIEVLKFVIMFPVEFFTRHVHARHDAWELRAVRVDCKLKETEYRLAGGLITDQKCDDDGNVLEKVALENGNTMFQRKETNTFDSPPTTAISTDKARRAMSYYFGLNYHEVTKASHDLDRRDDFIDWDDVTDFAQKVEDAAKSVFDALNSFKNKTKKFLREKFLKAWNEVVSVVSLGKKKIRNAMTSIKSQVLAIGAEIKRIGENAKNNVHKFVQGIKDYFTGIGLRIRRTYLYVKYQLSIGVRDVYLKLDILNTTDDEETSWWRRTMKSAMIAAIEFPLKLIVNVGQKIIWQITRPFRNLEGLCDVIKAGKKGLAYVTGKGRRSESEDKLDQLIARSVAQISNISSLYDSVEKDLRIAHNESVPPKHRRDEEQPAEEPNQEQKKTVSQRLEDAAAKLRHITNRQILMTSIVKNSSTAVAELAKQSASYSNFSSASKDELVVSMEKWEEAQNQTDNLMDRLENDRIHYQQEWEQLKSSIAEYNKTELENIIGQVKQNALDLSEEVIKATEQWHNFLPAFLVSEDSQKLRSTGDKVKAIQDKIENDNICNEFPFSSDVAKEGTKGSDDLVKVDYVKNQLDLALDQYCHGKSLQKKLAHVEKAPSQKASFDTMLSEVQEAKNTLEIERILIKTTLNANYKSEEARDANNKMIEVRTAAQDIKKRIDEASSEEDAEQLRLEGANKEVELQRANLRKAFAEVLEAKDSVGRFFRMLGDNNSPASEGEAPVSFFGRLLVVIERATDVVESFLNAVMYQGTEDAFGEMSSSVGHDEEDGEVCSDFNDSKVVHSEETKAMISDILGSSSSGSEGISSLRVTKGCVSFSRNKFQAEFGKLANSITKRSGSDSSTQHPSLYWKFPITKLLRWAALAVKKLIDQISTSVIKSMTNHLDSIKHFIGEITKISDSIDEDVRQLEMEHPKLDQPK
eukprot:Nk52_evm53s210 gene=Nk52_evmTU53s210